MFIKQNRPNLAVGSILIGVGILFLLGQALDFLRWDMFWPFVIIGVGATFFVGMMLGGKHAAPLAIPGSIISIVGLILFFQNTFGWWESWSYAWALIVAAVGAGIAISGVWGEKPEVTKDGLKVVRVGLTLFVVFAFIFEILFSVTGISDRPALYWAYLVVVLGLIMLISRLYRIIAREGAQEAERNDLFWPVLFIGVGVTVILANMNLVPEFNPLSLLRLWPLLLIAAGIQVIFGRRNAWVSGGIGLVVLATLLGFIFYGEQIGFNTTSPFAFKNNFIELGQGKRIQGSGLMSEQVRQVEDFDKIVLTSFGVLNIIQGGQEKLVVSAEDNIQEYIITRVEGSTLFIETRPDFSLSLEESIEITLTVRDLEKITVSGAGEVNIGALEVDDLTLTSSGLGSFEITNLSADSLDAEISGTGSIEVFGRVEELKVNISGMGSFDGENLQVQQADVDVPGLGSATVWVESSLTTNISGLGSISYYGSPTVNNHTSGLGTVRPMGDK